MMRIIHLLMLRKKYLFNLPNKRYKDESHLKWIRTLPCLLCKAGFYSHSKEVQAHHLLKPYDGEGRGMGMRSTDRNVIPLCLHHHAQLHTKFGNEFKFFESFGLPADFGQVWAKKLFEKKRFQDEVDDDLPF